MGLVVGLVVMAFGVLWLLAFVPGMGTDGSVTTTDCGTAPRHGLTCWGDFTPGDGGPPRSVSIDDVDEEDVTVAAVTYPWAPEQAFRPPGVLAAVESTAMTVAGGAVLSVAVTRLVCSVRATRRRNRFATPA
ncbi:hypothetical protein [Dactylosporangium fulvum]|uniref:DUF3592 domain-containing protein n=1 Tax=Dactylosporangium fulvum TaxID=53359 RepID=A0ABY5VSU2_9ACTN|nr:hypothetical protein [Dactylosporangium fulvum]UWP80813.1 hypothetical protein Dfulv_37605 [Dactylosporangium fulvum]